MDVTAEPARGGDGLQVTGEPVQIGLIEGLGEFCFVRFGDRTQRGEKPLILRGEMDLAAAAVRRAATPLDMPLSFQAVQDRSDPARPTPSCSLAAFTRVSA